MPSPSRPVERFEFTPDEADRVTRYMAQLAEARHGWINFLPGIADEAELPEPPRGAAGFFIQNTTPGLVMCTWVPAGSDRRRRDPTRIGILHTAGRARPRLDSIGIHVPPGWFIEQDHPSRGLVVRLPTEADGEVLGWLLKAGAALCGVPMTGKWRAEVFVPG
jgi:hypothetical protein